MPAPPLGIVVALTMCMVIRVKRKRKYDEQHNDKHYDDNRGDADVAARAAVIVHALKVASSPRLADVIVAPGLGIRGAFSRLLARLLL